MQGMSASHLAQLEARHRERDIPTSNPIRAREMSMGRTHWQYTAMVSKTLRDRHDQPEDCNPAQDTGAMERDEVETVSGASSNRGVKRYLKLLPSPLSADRGRRPSHG